MYPTTLGLVNCQFGFLKLFDFLDIFWVFDDDLKPLNIFSIVRPERLK